MAAAEARAVWQRTANRYYFIQEEAKRAPKLASCCPSISSVISKTETNPVNPADLNDSFPFPDEKSFCSDSKWWLQLQPDYMHQRGLTLTSDQVDPIRNPQFVVNQDDGSSIDIDSLSSKESYEFVQMDSVEVPWWQVAEKDDLNGPMHSGLGLRIIKCGQNTVSRGNSGHDTSKRKILEALCHSQTRAREAEIAAKKAYAEKEHAIKLVFKQASQLCAYRQWVYLLQIENACYQMKNKKSDVTSSIDTFLRSRVGTLSNNTKTVASEKGGRRRTKRGSGQYKHDLGKYAVVLVVGLGIVGAGLVLGWTIGWMLI